MKTFKTKWLILILLALALSGCSAGKSYPRSRDYNYPYQDLEPPWIRNGEPIIYEGQKWFPMDGTETLLDSEVLLAGEYRKIQFFIDKQDVRPYERLYTKFGKNKFRYFKKSKKKWKTNNHL